MTPKPATSHTALNAERALSEPVRVEPGMRTIPLPLDAPFAIGERVLVEAANGDRIVGVIAPGPTVELTAKLGPDAWRARVVRAPSW